MTSEKSLRAASKTDFATKIDKVWKVVAAIIGLLGVMSTAASWGFSYAMSDRDERVENLVAEVSTLNTHLTRMQEDAARREDRIDEDMRDVQIALAAIRIHLGRDMHAEANTPSTNPSAPRRPSSRPSLPLGHEDSVAVDGNTTATALNDSISTPAAPEDPDVLLHNAIDRLANRRVYGVIAPSEEE